MKDLFKVYKQPKLQNPSLILSWSEDIAQLGPTVINFLNNKLGGEKFADIEPSDFFAMGGVAIKNDLIHFPESEFYACKNNNLLLFRSDAPGNEWCKFLNLVLEIAENYCRVKEIYTIGGMASLIAHTNPRKIWTVVNQSELKGRLAGYGLYNEMNYRTPSGGRPTLNSYLLWVAKRRNISGVNLWQEIPFYLAQTADPNAYKTMIEFLGKKLNFTIDLEELNQQIEKQEGIINQFRLENPEIDECLSKLERTEELTPEENEKLAKEMNDLLSKER